MRYALLTLLLLAAPVYGQGVITLPVLPTPPAPIPPAPPAPKPAPGGPVVLAADVLYVASSKAECLLLVSTTDAGLKASDIVKVTAIKGPVTFALTRFVGGSGGRETKTYSDPFIWTVEAVGLGTIELLWVPKATTSTSAVVRQLVTTNTAPIPPPVPPVPPDPLAAKLQAAFAQETVRDKVNIGKLAALYKQSTTVANDPATVTVGDLFTSMKTAAQLLVGVSLPNVRKVIAAELSGVLPTNAATKLDAATRQEIAVEFAKIAQALGGIK